MKQFLVFVFLFFLCSYVFGQTFVQLERSGSLKVKRYYIGDELTFQLNGENYWYVETIQDILLKDNLILFSNRGVKPEEITAIKSFKNRRWSNAWGINLYVFGLGWGGFSLLGPLAGIPLSNLAWAVPVVAWTTGFLIQKIFKSKKLKIGTKRRLRLMSLDFIGP